MKRARARIVSIVAASTAAAFACVMMLALASASGSAQARPQLAATATVGPSTPIPDVTPVYTGKAPNQKVRPVHWPCALDQYKGNINSMIVHGPKQRDYAKVHKLVQCFDALDEAVEAGYRPAKR